MSQKGLSWSPELFWGKSVLVQSIIYRWHKNPYGTVGFDMEPEPAPEY